MNLVDHHEFAGLCTQERVRVLEPTSIDGALEIQVDAGSLTIGGNFPRQCRFADLAWAQQHDGGHSPQIGLDGRVQVPSQHITPDI